MVGIGYRVGPIISRIKEFKRVIEQHAIAKSRPVLLIVRVVQDLNRDDATHLAAGVAYYSIFSLFPLLLGLMAIMGVMLNSESMEQEFLTFITENLPGSGEFVEHNVEDIMRIRGALGVLAILGLLWSASAVFGASAGH